MKRENWTDRGCFPSLYRPNSIWWHIYNVNWLLTTFPNGRETWAFGLVHCSEKSRQWGGYKSVHGFSGLANVQSIGLHQNLGLLHCLTAPSPWVYVGGSQTLPKPQNQSSDSVNIQIRGLQSPWSQLQVGSLPVFLYHCKYHHQNLIIGMKIIQM